MEEIEKQEKSVNKKKSSAVGKFFKGFFIVLFVIIVAVAGYLGFCAFDSKNVLEVFPRDYSFYVHTDSAVDTVESVADLQAMDVLLSSDSFKGFRKAFMSYRSASFRGNSYFNFLANRKVDAAVYTRKGKAEFIACLDLSWLSAASRNAKVLYDYARGHSEIEELNDLNYFESDDFSYFIYKSKDSESPVYIVCIKNLVLASSSLELLKQAVLTDDLPSYKAEEVELLKSSAGNGIRVVVDAKYMVNSISGNGNDIIASLAKLLDGDNLSVVDFNITDSDISVDLSVPFAINTENPSALEKVLAKESTSPLLLNRSVDCIQYYTFLNAGSLEELKDAVFPLVPAEKKIDDTWESADSLCNSVLGLSLDELLFSWSGKEFAAFGVEHQNDPVFAIQINDEKKRQEVFEKITNSFLIKEDNSLILGGVRLSRISVPNFINWLLEKFDIKMPSPYYMVHEGFIYFSESPESLSAIYTNSVAGKPLVKNVNWKSVSTDMDNESTVSLYYNLERSVPFFMRKNKDISNVLKLYTIGRFDVKLGDNKLELKLHACARKSGDLTNVPGYPFKLNGKSDPDNFVIESGSSPQALFWVENGKMLNCLNLASLETKVVNLMDNCYIAAANETSKDKGILWCTTTHGDVYLYNRELEVMDGFPVVLGTRISASPSAGKNCVYIPLEDGTIAKVTASGGSDIISCGEEAIDSRISVAGDYLAAYEKGFLGNIYTFKNERIENKDNPVFVPEIGFDSAALMKTSGHPYVGFVSQAGNMYVWRNNEMVENFPVELEGKFQINCQASEKYFYALSDEAILYRVSADGEVLAVRIPNSTAHEAYLSVIKVDGKYQVFVCADANVIYGFNENLELLSAFPLVGWGRPVFADVDGDKITECLALTLDRKITAWKLR